MRSRLRTAAVGLALASSLALGQGAWAQGAGAPAPVTLRDVMLTLRAAVGAMQPSADDLQRLDVAPWVGWGQTRGDGKITILDAQREIQYMLGLVSSDQFYGVTNASYVGAQVCSACHPNIHKTWSGTSHANAYVDLKNATGGDPTKMASCIGCHSVGYGKGGFVDEASTPDLEGVQCESCHGPGSAHVAGGGDTTKILKFPTNMAAQVCENCHNGSHNPFKEEFEASPHAQIVPHVATYFQQDQNVSTCGPCHSSEYKISQLIGKPAPAGHDLQYGETCATCHDPHARTGNDPVPTPGRDHQLRLPSSSDSVSTLTVCGTCHHKRDDDDFTKTSRPPHHSPQFSFLLGDGGTLDPAPATPIRTTHASVPGQCITCHMYSQPADETTGAAAIVGHTFEVNLKACVCHGAGAQALKDGTQTEIKNDLTALKARLDKWGNWEYVADGGPKDQSTMPTEILKARYNYYYVTNDGSYGVHNAKYTRALLDYANAQLDSIGVPK